MAVLAAILPLVSRSSALALELYRLAAGEPEAAKELVKTAKSISNLALIVKQVGTIVKEDDRLPSEDALESLEDILAQCTDILGEIESIVAHHRNTKDRDGKDAEQNGRIKPNSAVVARLNYLVAHLDALRLTTSVMLQTLYTSQSIIWAKVRPTVSPTQCANAVANEKYQLETLIIEQQLSILLASKLYTPSRADTRFSADYDCSQSLVAVGKGGPQPANLFQYQDSFIKSLDARGSNEDQWLGPVCGSSRTQVDRLLDRWSRLRQFEESLQDAERKAQAEKRETQQPFVESDIDDEVGALPKFAGSGIRLTTPTPRRPDKPQPLFTETTTLPIPVRDPKFGPTAPLSPASSFGVSPRSSGSNLPIPNSPSSSPVSPRASIGTLPVEAAAAVKAKDKHDDANLEIPWTLCTRRHWWKYVDDKIEDSNTNTPSSDAWTERNSWTEVLASWVCKEAIKEAGYHYTRRQMERRDGKQTKFETCFCIDRPLTFKEVHRLVERTVEIYRKTQPPSPPPQGPRRSSMERRSGTNSSSSGRERDRPPSGNHNHHQHPPLERSITTYPPPPPPPLDRSLSMPGAMPTYPSNPRASNTHLPQPTASSPLAIQQPPHSAAYPPESSPHATQYFPHVAPQPNPYIPQHASYPPHAAPFSPQGLYASPQSMYPPNGAPFGPYAPNMPMDPRFLQPNAGRQTYPESSHSSHRDRYSSTESDSTTRSRKHRSKSRRRSESRSSHYRKKSHEHSGATKALMGVAGLTALLDGLVGL